MKPCLEAQDAAAPLPLPVATATATAAAIERLSHARALEATDLSPLPPALRPLALRLVQSCAMPDIVPELAWSEDFLTEASKALRRGAPVLCDSRMTACGIRRDLLPSANAVICTLGADGVTEAARRGRMTLSAAAVALWRPRLDGAVVAIGNAPTALWRLMEGLDAGWPQPSAVCAFAVGFVGAEEAKEAFLSRFGKRIAHVALCGRRGGSMLAAAAVNGVAAGLGAAAAGGDPPPS